MQTTTNTNARNARFVVDIDDNQQLEIPFDIFNRSYEGKIRASERARMRKRQKRMIHNIIRDIKMMIKMTWQKTIGICMIVSTIMMLRADVVDTFDWVIAGLIFPVAIYLTLSKTFLFKKRY